MDVLVDVSLVDGPVLWFSFAAALAGSIYLLWNRRRFWLAWIVAAVVAAAGLLALLHWLLIYVFASFSEDLPLEVLAWSLPAVAALLLCGARLWRSSWRGRLASVAALAGVVLLSAVQINIYFGLNGTVADLTGTAVARVQQLEDALKRQPGGSARPDPTGWTAPDALPSGGILRKASIPGTASGFSAREAFIYLPPAYQSANRPALPVLVLFSGQPGGPSDWLSGGHLRGLLDKVADRNGGVAPVAVVVDPNGTGSANTMCMDSKIAKADTYLSQDVPAWIMENLDVTTDPHRWAVGGFSFGGTCAVQMGTMHPQIYPTVLAFSAEQEPTLARDRGKTIADSFDGDVEAFESRTPLVLMSRQQYAGNSMYFTAGGRDHEFMTYRDTLAAAAAKAGFAVESRTIANAGHSWDAVVQGMPEALDFLMARWGLSR